MRMSIVRSILTAVVIFGCLRKGQCIAMKPAKKNPVRILEYTATDSGKKITTLTATPKPPFREVNSSSVDSSTPQLPNVHS